MHSKRLSTSLRHQVVKQTDRFGIEGEEDSDKGDGEVTGADVAWGFDNERSNLFLSLSYTEQKEVSSADRYISSIPIQGGSSRILGGRYAFTDPNGNSYDLSVKPGQIA